MAKRGYKLQEFVAHASAVKCLSIGKKTSRLLVTGGEDHRVNLWAIGKPDSLLSLSGHTSSVESVTFDSAEVLVVSGASTGAIKLWDLEEAKIVRTLTGHTSHCNTVEFHPFGEFFALGSSDTNLKIWDVRKKGCIHTYKGHTRGINTIRFTPDGRWVVSGGADSVVKVWDLTAGKLLHELKFHDRQIQCLDFHPLEFLLASGSADRTVNFWDLETFELIGSAGPEATGVRSMTFHPDGKTLFCGLEDSLKVFSWEPIICHDAVDMGWSTLCDLSIREGKLLACSFYRNCVGVWIADISLIGPYGTGIPHQSTGHMERKFDFPEMPSAEKPKSLVRSGTAVLPTAQDSDTDIRNIYVDTSASKKAAPKRIGTVHASKVASPVDSSEAIGPSPLKKGPEANMQTRSNSSRQAITVPIIVPRNNRNAEHAVNSRRESVTPESSSPGILLKQAHIGRTSNSKHEMDSATRTDSRCFSSKTSDLDSSPEPKFHFSFFPAKNEASEDSNDSHRSINNVTEKFERILTQDVPRSSSHNTSADPQSYNEGISFLRPVSGADQLGRTRSLVERWEKREICSPPSTVPTEPAAPAAPIAPPAPAAPIVPPAPTAPAAPIAPPAPTAPAAPIAPTAPTAPAAPIAPPAPTVLTSRTMFAAPVGPTDEKPGSRTLLHVSKGEPETSGRSTCKSDEDVLEDLMRSHDTFSSTLRSRLTKLQVVRHFWQRNDVKGGISAVGKLPDHHVQADVISVLMEKMDIVTLDLFSSLLPMVLGLLNSHIDRHTSTSLEILLKLVAIFGPVIRATVSARPSVGVDLQAERRRECCTHCFMQLQKIKQVLPSVIRRGGLLAKSAHELNLVLQES